MAEIPLPPGFTAAKMSQAQKAFEAALGADKVFFEDLDRVGYQDKFAIDDARHHPAGAIAPTSVEEVQAAGEAREQQAPREPELELDIDVAEAAPAEQSGSQRPAPVILYFPKPAARRREEKSARSRSAEVFQRASGENRPVR